MLSILLRTILALWPVVPEITAIVGGDLIDIEQIPYLVNIRKNGMFQCGGSLITPRCILTAAHCVRNSTVHEFVVRGGVTYLNDFRNGQRVANMFLPAGYDSINLNHDVAILQLKSRLAGKSIESIALSDRTPATGDLVQVSGWGLTDENANRPSNQLRSVMLRVMDLPVCRQLYENYRNVTDAMFCASIPGYKDACSADSGGPAVYDRRLIGVVSWGRGTACARPEWPGVYVNISELRSWIDAIVTKFCH